MKGKQSTRKRVIHWLVAGLLSVFTVLGLSLFLLTLSPGERFLKRIVEFQLQDLLGQDVQIGALETNLLSRLQLRNVRIYQVQSGQRSPFLSFGYANVQYSLTSVLRRQLSIRSLDLDSLNLTIRRDSSGVFNLPLPNSSARLSNDATSQPFRVRLNQLSIQHSSLQYLDSMVPIEGSLQNTTIAVRYGADDNYNYQVQVDSGRVKYQGVPLTWNHMELAGLWSPRQWRVHSMSVNLPHLKLTGNASLENDGEHPVLTGDFCLHGNPDLLLQAANERFPKTLSPIQGDLNLTLHLEGSLHHPKVNAQLDLGAFEIATIRVPRGLIKMIWEPGSLDLEELRLELLGGVISGQGEICSDSLITHHLSLKTEGIDLAQAWQVFHQGTSPYQGKINAEILATGQEQRLKDWDVSANILLQHVKYQSQLLPDFRMQLSLRRGLAEFLFEQEDSRITAKAELDGKQLVGQFSADISKLEPLAGLFHARELAGILKINGHLRGAFNSPEIAADIYGKNISYRDFPVDTLVGHILYRNKGIYVTEVSFAGSLDPIDTLRAPFHLEKVAGGVAYRGRASGPADNPKAELTIDLNQPGYGDFGFDRGQLQVALSDRQINLSYLHLQRDSLFIQATGDFLIPSVSGGCKIKLFAILPGSRAREQREFGFPPEMDETLGNIHQVGDLTATFDLLEANRFLLQLEGDQLDLEKIRTLFPKPLDIGGSLQFHLDVSRNLDNLRAQLAFRGESPRYQLVEIDSVKGHLAFADERLQLGSLELYDKGHFSRAMGTIELERRGDGSYFVSERGLLQGGVHGEDFDLSVLNPLLPDEMQVSGRSFCDLSWHGTIANPHPAGTLVVRDGMVQLGPNAPAIQQINITFSVQDSVLHIEKVSGVIRETPFQLQGQIVASQLECLNLQVDISISHLGVVAGRGTISRDSLRCSVSIEQMDLSLLQPFFADLKNLCGRLNTEITLSGSLQNPQLNGQLQVRELAVQPPWLNAPLSRGVIKARFDRNRVKIDSLSIRINGGRVFASGNFAHHRRALSDANLQVRINDLKITRPKEAVALIKSVQLEYRKENSYYLLDGDIVLGQTRMLVNFKPQSVLPFARKMERPKQELPSLFRQTRMNLRLRESKDIWIDNNLARLRLHTELGFTGTLEKPNLTGRVAVKEGYVLYLDRKFQIKQGVMDFVDPDRLNPIIDLKAETTIRSYQTEVWQPYAIRLSVVGPLDQVQVELTSEPLLDKSDIITLLTLGSTREQLGDREARGNVLLERAKDLSSQRLTGYTERRIGKLLGLEQVTIEGDLFRFDKSWGPRLVASKKISRRMDVTYTTTVGYINDQSIQLDYRLSKKLSLESQTDQRGRSAIDLKYILRFP